MVSKIKESLSNKMGQASFCTCVMLLLLVGIGLFGYGLISLHKTSNHVQECLDRQPAMVEHAKAEIMENIQQNNKEFIIRPDDNHPYFYQQSTDEIIDYGTKKGLHVIEVVYSSGAVVFENKNVK